MTNMFIIEWKILLFDLTILPLDTFPVCVFWATSYTIFHCSRFTREGVPLNGSRRKKTNELQRVSSAYVLVWVC